MHTLVYIFSPRWYPALRQNPKTSSIESRYSRSCWGKAQPKLLLCARNIGPKKFETFARFCYDGITERAFSSECWMLPGDDGFQRSCIPAPLQLRRKAFSSREKSEQSGYCSLYSRLKKARRGWDQAQARWRTPYIETTTPIRFGQLRGFLEILSQLLSRSWESEKCLRTDPCSRAIQWNSPKQYHETPKTTKG